MENYLNYGNEVRLLELITYIQQKKDKTQLEVEIENLLLRRSEVETLLVSSLLRYLKKEISAEYFILDLVDICSCIEFHFGTCKVTELHNGDFQITFTFKTFIDNKEEIVMSFHSDDISKDKLISLCSCICTSVKSEFSEKEQEYYTNCVRYNEFYLFKSKKSNMLDL